MRRVFLFIILVGCIVVSCSTDNPVLDEENVGQGGSTGGSTSGVEVPSLGEGEILLYFYNNSQKDKPEFAITADYISIDWGDNSPIQEFKNGSNKSITHTYSSMDYLYTIKVKTKNITKFISSHSTASINPYLLSGIIFGYCSNLVEISTGAATKKDFDVSRCVNLESLNLHSYGGNLDFTNNKKLKNIRVGYAIDYIKFAKGAYFDNIEIEADFLDYNTFIDLGGINNLDLNIDGTNGGFDLRDLGLKYLRVFANGLQGNVLISGNNDLSDAKIDVDSMTIIR